MLVGGGEEGNSRAGESSPVIERRDEPLLSKAVTQPTGLVVKNTQWLPDAPLRGASDAIFLFAYRYDLAEIG